MNQSTTEGETVPTASEVKHYLLWSQVFRTIRHLISAGMLVTIAYFAYRAVVSLAGEVTLVTASLSLMKSSYGLPWGLAAVMFVWAMGERQLRRSKTEEMSDHIRLLESRIDPNRTSSGL